MKDIYFIECSICGFQVNVLLDKKPKEHEKVICDTCKEKSDSNWY